jgi:hypothetical protein
VAVDASHAWNLVAHMLGLQDVADTYVIEPRLVTMTETVQRQIRL